MQQKQYDWKDSNLALFGSDTDKAVKKESAEQESAWKGCGKDVGIWVWRIVDFKVTCWPKEDYGQFYSGDSYIVLNCYKEQNTSFLKLDVHFWIGKNSTQDEYGTAAYKTVELDTYLDDQPIQHREVQGHESRLFKSYFKEFVILRGGAASGFSRNLPESYSPRLLRVHNEGKMVNTTVSEVDLCRSALDQNDVFILDMGQVAYIYQGSHCNMNEKFKATQFAQKMKNDRFSNMQLIYIEDGDENSIKFFDALQNNLREQEQQKEFNEKNILYKLSDETGDLKFDKIIEAKKFDQKLLDSSSVFILDCSYELFVWIGNKASINERKNSISYAHKYLMNSDNPFKPIHCLGQDQQSSDFDLLFESY